MQKKKRTQKKTTTRKKQKRKNKQLSLPLHPFQTFLVGLLTGGLIWLSPLAKKEVLSTGIVEVDAKSTFGFEPPRSLPIIEKEGYLLAYDSRTRLASWVYEHLTPESVEIGVDPTVFEYRERPRGFFPHHAMLENIQREQQSDSLCVIEDQLCSERDIEDTYSLTNITPQIPWFNRDYWDKLESKIQLWAKNYDHLYVVSGTLFLPIYFDNGERIVQYSVIGENDIAVPTHFYKVVLIENSGDIAMKAFVVPNEMLSTNIPLKEFEVSVKDVEQMTGLTFFPNLDTELADHLKTHY